MGQHPPQHNPRDVPPARAKRDPKTQLWEPPLNGVFRDGVQPNQCHEQRDHGDALRHRRGHAPVPRRLVHGLLQGHHTVEREIGIEAVKRLSERWCQCARRTVAADKNGGGRRRRLVRHIHNRVWIDPTEHLPDRRGYANDPRPGPSHRRPGRSHTNQLTEGITRAEEPVYQPLIDDRHRLPARARAAVARCEGSPAFERSA